MLTRNVTCSLRPISGTYRRRIRERYDGPTSLTKESRIALAQAIFEVENDAEHKLGTRHPQVQAMNSVRNLLLDDAGENETQLGSRYPQHDWAARLIAEKRRKGNPDAFRAVQEARAS